MTLQERAKELNNRLFHTSSHKDEERVAIIELALIDAVKEENEACAKTCEDSVKPEIIAGDPIDLCTMSPYQLAKAIRSRLEAK